MQAAKVKMSPEEELQKAHHCMRLVREIIKKDGKLCIPSTDIWLLRFVRARKYNPDLVYENLKKYYEARHKWSKTFKDLHPTVYKHVYESGVISLLKHRDEHQRKTFVFRVSKWDPAKFTVDEMMMAGFLMAEQMSFCPINQRVGAVIIVDETGLCLNQMRHLGLSSLHKLVVLFQDSFPGIYKGMHLVNQPYVWDVLCNLFKRFVKKKLVKRIHLHREIDSLTKMVDPNLLPVSMGGNLPEEEAYDDEIVPAMYKNDNYYKELSKYGFKNKDKIK